MGVSTAEKKRNKWLFTQGLKHCARCDCDLPIDHFSKGRASTFGLSAYCKACASQRYFEHKAERAESRRRYRARNRERSREHYKQFRQDNRERIRADKRLFYEEHKQEILAKQREYYQQNRERIRARQRQSYLDNIESRRVQAHASYQRHRQKNLARVRLYRKAHIEEIREKEQKKSRLYSRTTRGKENSRMSTQRRQARQADLPADLTYEQWQAALEYFGHKCAYCGAEEEVLHQEHFIPVVAEGGWTVANIVPACGFCNRQKGPKMPWEWASGKALERIRCYFEEVLCE